MVVKIQSSHRAMEGTLSYNQRKVEKGVARVVSAVNLPSAFPGDIRRTFSRFENRNRTTDRVSFQMSVNPDPSRPEERLSDPEVREFVSALMKGLGYASQPYVIYEHRDIDRTHYHVVSIRTDWEGKKIRDYREQYRCQKLLRENAQRFHYRLGGETAGKGGPGKAPPGRFDPGAGEIRRQYLSLFKESTAYRFASLAQFRALLLSKGLLLDTRDTATGPDLILQGADADGKPVSQRISGQEMGVDLYGLFSKRTEQCRKLDPVPKSVKIRVARWVHASLSRSWDEKAFVSILSRQGIHASIFRTRADEIYGATFIDSASKTVLKGSELPGITMKVYGEADQRWKAAALRDQARILTEESSPKTDWNEDPTRIPSYPENQETDEVMETVIEESETDVVDDTLEAVTALLGRAGDFGSASQDDGRIHRKKKKRTIKRIR